MKEITTFYREGNSGKYKEAIVSGSCYNASVLHMNEIC
jgi:hypothetical protein